MNGDLGEMINKLTSDPESLGKLMQMANGFMKKSGNGEQQNDGNSPFETEKEVNNSDHSPRERENDYENNVVRPPDRMYEKTHERKNKGKSEAENLIRLLLALKPFVGESRCEKIDSVVRILKLVQLGESAGLIGNPV